MKKNKLFFIISLLFSINYLLLLYKRKVEHFKEHLSLNTNHKNDIEKYVVQTIENAIQNIRPDKDGNEGKKGDRGKRGESGGTFTNKGFLRSLKFPTLFVKRTNNGLKLDKKKYNSNFIWTHESNGKMKSQSNKGRCMDIKNNKLYLNEYKKAGTWTYNENSGHIKYNEPINGKNMCLYVKKNPSNDINQRYLLDIDKCKPNNEQSWMFF